MQADEQLRENAEQYAIIAGCKLVANPDLGHGTDGHVWRSNRGTAIKAFYATKNFEDELECYCRLKEKNISEILGLAVPTHEGHSEEFLTIEMSIVQRPYLLDFGKVYIDHYPPYLNDPQLMQNWHEEVRGLFDENTAKVHAVLRYLRRLGIHYVDPKPANIRF